MRIYTNKHNEVILVHGDDFWEMVVDGESRARLDGYWPEDGASIIYDEPNEGWHEVTDDYPRTFKQRPLIDSHGEWFLTFEYPGQRCYAANRTTNGVIEWTEDKLANEMSINDGSPFNWVEVFEDEDYQHQEAVDFETLSQISLAADAAGRQDGDSLAHFVTIALGEWRSEELKHKQIEKQLHAKADALQAELKIKQSAELHIGKGMNNLKGQLRADIRSVFSEFVEKVDVSSITIESTKKINELDVAVRMSAVAYLVGTMIAAVVYGSMMYQIFWSKS